MALQGLFVGHQPVLVSLALAHVAQEADEELGATLLSLANREIQRKGASVLSAPDHRPANADDPPLACLAIMSQIAIVSFMIGRRHQDLDVLAEHLPCGKAEHRFASRVEHANRAQGIDDNHAVDRGFDDRAMLCFAIAQLLLDPRTLGDVANHRDENLSLLKLKCADREFHGKLGVVLAQTRERPGRAGRLAAFAGPTRGGMSFESLSKRFDDEDLGVPADDFAALVAEHPLAGLVEQQDPVVVVDQDDAIDDGVGDGPQRRTAIALEYSYL